MVNKGQRDGGNVRGLRAIHLFRQESIRQSKGNMLPRDVIYSPIPIASLFGPYRYPFTTAIGRLCEFGRRGPYFQMTSHEYAWNSARQYGDVD